MFFVPLYVYPGCAKRCYGGKSVELFQGRRGLVPNLSKVL